MKKRFWTRLAAAIVALSCLIPWALCARAEETEMEKEVSIDEAVTLNSQGIYLMNLETGKVLYDRGGTVSRSPASLTKIMTAVVVLENCRDPETTTVTVPDANFFKAIIEDGGVHMELTKGETFTVYDLLKGMMISSYCDAAELLAWHFGKMDTNAFVKKMNEKAKEIGMEDTRFINAHGLEGKAFTPENLNSPADIGLDGEILPLSNLSTPRDVALLLAYAVQNARFVELISARGGTLPATEYHAARTFSHTVGIFSPKNEYYRDFFVGGKSGFTDNAGRCLATYSVKDGLSFVSVMMGGETVRVDKKTQNMAWVDTSVLLTYVYDNYSLRTVLKQGEHLGEVPVIDSEVTLPVVAGEDVKLLLRKDADDPERSLDLPPEISVTEVENGALVGRATLTARDGGIAVGRDAHRYQERAAKELGRAESVRPAHLPGGQDHGDPGDPAGGRGGPQHPRPEADSAPVQKETKSPETLNRQKEHRGACLGVLFVALILPVLQLVQHGQLGGADLFRGAGHVLAGDHFIALVGEGRGRGHIALGVVGVTQGEGEAEGGILPQFLLRLAEHLQGRRSQGKVVADGDAGQGDRLRIFQFGTGDDGHGLKGGGQAVPGAQILGLGLVVGVPVIHDLLAHLQLVFVFVIAGARQIHGGHAHLARGDLRHAAQTVLHMTVQSASDLLIAGVERLALDPGDGVDVPGAALEVSEHRFAARLRLGTPHTDDIGGDIVLIGAAGAVGMALPVGQDDVLSVLPHEADDPHLFVDLALVTGDGAGAVVRVVAECDRIRP